VQEEGPAAPDGEPPDANNGQSTDTRFDGAGEDWGLAPEPMPSARLAATRHAGVVSAVLALTCGGIWYTLRRREE
jgi:hypothetical protein